MKKLLLLSAFISILGCSTDEPECVCSKAKYIKVSDLSTYYEKNVAIDCETGEPLNNDSYTKGVFAGCEE